jgi:hypothetical protein
MSIYASVILKKNIYSNDQILLTIPYRSGTLKASRGSSIPHTRRGCGQNVGYEYAAIFGPAKEYDSEEAATEAILKDEI